ncbi:thiamine pyrophosphokinase [Corynebacterium xerosis]|uniref:Thiamine pyrophosphokinase n=1 Tax=Corynebacterium xerosis TaxID=1725 RepID=A0A6B8TX77_9CORY|nr:putative cytokinetic ring protein SteA [Corynebacterium xerosis]QGS35713.1 thiamine pyrophosphokinase [Corynebacterium xerosis]
MSLFSKKTVDEPGIKGVVRDCLRSDRALNKLGEGDIVVIDAPDVTRVLAQRIIDAKAGAVVNTGAFTTGAVPNFGPQMLLDADVILVENAVPSEASKIRDGKVHRLYEGKLYLGDRRVAAGDEVTMDKISKDFDDARTGMVDRLEAFSGNFVEFAATESPLYVDGLGIPDVETKLAGRKVLLVSPGAGHEETLKNLKGFIREFDPVLIGVDAGADALVGQGYEPDLIIGDPEGIRSETLRSGARVILPADPDGHAQGLEHIQDLGIGAMTFPALSDSATDLALVLADHHGASMIVNVGSRLDQDDVYGGADQRGLPSALLSRLKAGDKLVDGDVVADLYRVEGGGLRLMWALLAIIVALAVIIAIAGTAGDGSVGENLVDTWNSIALWFQGLFN